MQGRSRRLYSHLMNGGLQIVEHELPSVCRYPKRLVLLVALIALAFATSTLQAQILTSTQENKFDKAGRPASSVASYREPVITCTVGRAGFIGHGGRQAATIEMVAALAVAYVVFGGAILALVASFRSLGDKVDSFFTPLIPKPTVRTIAPPDEHFSPFKFKPSAKQEASRLAPGSPPEASTSSEASIPPALFPRSRLTARRRSLQLGGCPSLNWKPMATNQCLHRFDTGFVPTANHPYITVTRSSPLISCVSRQRPGRCRILGRIFHRRRWPL